MRTASQSTTDGTTTMSTSLDLEDLPVYGYPGPVFYAIHVTAIVCLTISILTSAGVLLYLLLYNDRSKVKFFKRPIGERLVVYLALCDLFFSIAHELDHTYMLTTKDHPPDRLCIFFAFFVQNFILAQALLVIFTALSTMILVLFEKKVHLGRFDWRLISFTFGIPTVNGIVGSLVPYLGQSGAW